MMPYPADFLPRSIMRPTRSEISLLPNNGSGSAGLLGGTLRLGILYNLPCQALGFLAPYLERALRRSSTPSVSLAPRTMW